MKTFISNIKENKLTGKDVALITFACAIISGAVLLGAHLLGFTIPLY